MWCNRKKPFVLVVFALLLLCFWLFCSCFLLFCCCFFHVFIVVFVFFGGCFLFFCFFHVFVVVFGVLAYALHRQWPRDLF